MKHVPQIFKQISMASRGNCFLSICQLKSTHVENILPSNFFPIAKHLSFILKANKDFKYLQHIDIYIYMCVFIYI